MIRSCIYPSPLGPLTLSSDGECLIGLSFAAPKGVCPVATDDGAANADLPVFIKTRRWLDIYFAGQMPDFLPPLQLSDTPFRRMVEEIMLSIPYGTTTTYSAIASEVARRMGRSAMSAQAVGQAVGHNPLGIIVPCHRVMGARGNLTGYAGGLDRKLWLLRHEGSLLL